jgi:MoxR-like ATPase
MGQIETGREIEYAQQLAVTLKKIRDELKKRIIGQEEVIDDLLACFLSGGHCLLVGVPGLAKTLLVRSLAGCLALDFNRIQFTPDLMPSDITGSEILFDDRVAGKREFQFVKGPIFSNIILADEINRTPPKTQSALLQAMQEHEVTSSGVTFALPDPFWVLATQNPIEQEGTYPLPEAQQDRFMFSIEMGYPDYNAEFEIVKTTTKTQDSVISPVVTLDEVRMFRQIVWDMPVADSGVAVAVNLVRATRPESRDCSEKVKRFLTWGAGPRAAQFLVLAAKSFALLDSRPAADKEDVIKAAPLVLRHRLVRSFHAEVEAVRTDEIIAEVVKNVNK